jgi:orotidine-5'-phosphate decarboxylase
MVVCGATWPEEARRLRAILPNTLFLVPGYGAQGGAARDALAGLVQNRAGSSVRCGGVVSSSRAILYPKACADQATLAGWRDAFCHTLNASIAALRDATDFDAPVR